MSTIVYYKLDSNVLDYGPNGYDGNNNGVSFVSGIVNNAGDFEASENDYIEVTNSELDDLFDNDWSIAFHITPETVSGGNKVMVSKKNSHSGTSVGWAFCIDSGSDLHVFITDSNGNDINQKIYNNLSASTSYHVIITIDRTNDELKCYIDNVLQTTVDISSLTGNLQTTTNLRMGSTGNGSNDYDGLLDEVRIIDTIFTAKERYDVYTFDGEVEILINEIDYSLAFNDFHITKESIFTTSIADIELDDPDGSITNAIKRFMELKLYFNGNHEWTGLINNINTGDNNSGTIGLYCLDYWDIMARTPHSKEYTSTKRSAVLSDMLTTNEFIKDYNIGTSKIDATVETRDYKFKGTACSDIASRFALQEDYVTHIDKDKDLVFKSNTKDDTGIHLIYANGDIWNENFEKTGTETVNALLVRGRLGRPPSTSPKSIIYESEEVISETQNNRLPMPEVNAPTLETYDDLIEWAESEIQSRNEMNIRGELKTDLDFDIVNGQLITLTVDHENITADTFYILTVEHTYSLQQTKIVAHYYTQNTADTIDNIVRKTIKTEQYVTDEASVPTRAKRITENVKLSAFVDIDRRTYSGAEYGEFNYGEKYYGQVSGSWTSVISNEQIKVMNQLFEDFLRWVAQISTIPNQIDGTNAHVAVGSGTSNIDYGDTTLENENNRVSMEPGYPRRTSTRTGSLRGIIGDAEAITATISNVAIFNNSSSGNMEIAGVLSSSVSKAADEEIRITFRITVTKQNYLTDSGGNLLIDIALGQSSDYIDSSNGAIEVTTDGPTTYREGMDSGEPSFLTSVKQSAKFQITIDTSEITGNSLDGEAFTELDLYNKTSSGVKVIDGTVASVTFNNVNDVLAQIIMKMVRTQ